MKKFIFLLAITLFANFSFLNAQFAFKDAPNSKQTELKSQLVLETEPVDLNPQSQGFLFQEISVKEEKESTRPATRAALELGYCDGIVNANYGTTLAAAGTHYISGCIAFTSEYISNYVGATLHSIETGIGITANMANLTSYKVWIKKSLNGAIEYEQDVFSQVTTGTVVTWKAFLLDMPYPITSGPLVIGFTAGFTTVAANQGRYPLPTETVDAPYPTGGYHFLLSTSATGHHAGATWGMSSGDRALHIWGQVTGNYLTNNNLCAAGIAKGASANFTTLGNPSQFTVIVHNSGTLPQSNYSVQLIKASDNSVLTTVPVTTPILSGSYAKISVPYTFLVTGDNFVKGKVILTGDQNPLDDISTETVGEYIYPMPPMAYCNNTAISGGGYGPNLVGSTAIGYTAANSGPYVGKKLTAIRVGISSPYATYTNCKVWIASTLATTQTYLYEQNFTPTNDGWITVVLNTPYELTSAQTYIGWTGTCSSTGQFSFTTNPPAVADGGRIKNGTSAWTTIQTAFGSTNYNAALIGVIVSPPPCPAITNLNTNITGNNVTLSWTAATGTPTGYEVRFRGTVLATVPAGTTTYTHVNAPKGQHEYCVTALHGAEECVPQNVCKTVTLGEVCELKVVMKGTSATSWNATTGGIEVIADGYSYGILRGNGATTVTHNLLLPEGTVNFIWTTGGTPAQQSFDILNTCGEVEYSRATGSLSAGISPLAFSVTHGCPCEKLKFLSLDMQDNCDAKLEFYDELLPYGWLRHSVSDAVVASLGFSGGTPPINTAVAMRFTPQDLVDKNISSGQTITKVALGFGEDLDQVNSITLTIWEGGTSIANPGTIVYTQPITGFAAFPEYEMQEFTLNTPFVIDATKELRIGYQISIAAINAYPMGADVGPAVPGKGGLIDNGGWVDISVVLTTFNRNWSIKAYVDLGTLSWEPEPVPVNIYRDGVVIKDNYFGNTYTDVRTNFDITLPHTWAVARVCEDTRESCKLYASADACKTAIAYDCNTDKSVGTGTVGIATNPISLFYDWGYTQQLYLGSEIGFGGTGYIGAITFDYIYTSPTKFNTVDIYLGNTTLTTFASNTAWVALANLSKVYSGTVNCATGLVTIEFDTPFEYTGGNLVVALNKMTPEWNSSTSGTTPSWKGSSGATNMCIYIQNFTASVPYNPASPGTGTRISNRPNAIFSFCEKQYTLNPNDIYGAGVSVTLNPPAITEGQNGTVYFTITNPCYRIIDVIIGGVSMGPITSFTFTNVTAPLPLIEVITSNKYDITATAGANGSISPSGTNPFNTCENHTFTFTPASCFMVDVVTVNGTPVSITGNTYTFTNITAPQTIHVTFKYITHTINATAGTNGTISPSGTATVNQCTDHTYTITPNECYEVDVFTVNGTPTALTPGTITGTFIYTITGINANYIINVTFKNIKHNIVATAGSNGSISPAGTTAVDECANQTYTFTPASCYMIDVVTVNGTPVTITGNTFTFTNVSAPATIHVTFKYITHTITATAGANGTITPSGTATVNQCSNHTYTITPNSCFMVDVVTVNGLPVSIPAAGGTYTFNNVSANQVINATFKYITHNIVASAGFGGTISPSGTQVVNQCSTHTFTFTPNFGYHILQVLVNGIPNAQAVDNGFHTFTNISSNNSISVTFELNCYELNPANELGSGVVFTMNPPNCVYHGYDVTFTFKPLGCTELVDVWIDGFGNLGPIPSFTMYNIIGPLPKIVIEEYVQTFNIDATVNNTTMGTISNIGNNQFNCGQTVTYNFLPGDGYRVKTVKVNGITNPAAIAAGFYTFHSIITNHAIYVEFEAIPIYIIQFGPNSTQGKVYPTLDPTALYFKEYYEGSTAQFTIEPGAGFEIDKVYVDDVITTITYFGTYTFTNIQINHSIFATFKPIIHTITATATVGGNINPAGVVSVNQGATQDFGAVPLTGYHIEGIYVDGILDPAASLTGLYSFTNVVTNHTIHAVFAVDTYIITATAGAYGTITPAGEVVVDHGSNQTFNFMPAEGYKINKVLINTYENPVAAQTGTYTFTDIDQDNTIHVTFTKQMLKITANAGPNGTVQPQGIDYVEYWLHSQIYVFNPAPGYHIKEVLVDNVNNPLAIQNGEYRFLNVTTDHTLLVFFAKDNYTINAMATAGGNINPSGLTTVPAGNNKTFYFEPYAGYKLTQVIINGINYPEAVDAGFYTFYNVYDDYNITAIFEQATYTVTLPTEEGIVAAPVGGSNSPVAYGGSYNFVVDLLAGYTNSKLTVSANGIVINPVSGVYTINNITIDQLVAVIGIEKNVYKVSAKANAGGTILPAGVFNVAHGESKAFEMIPDKDFVVKSVVVNGIDEGIASSYTFHNVTSDGVVEVFFKYNPLNLVDPDGPTIQIYSNKNVVTISNEELIPVKLVEIMDMYGRVVWQGQTTGAKTEITLNVATGIYGVRIATDDGFTVTKVSITK
ncbi:MAG: T9SS type A sorting domain-containing protein [Bacteroidales bacterium]|jgi:hypothetical protein|nr:T9SS type A sorting domain-containing protein [Bacteroidales bacterium]